MDGLHHPHTPVVRMISRSVLDFRQQNAFRSFAAILAFSLASTARSELIRLSPPDLPAERYFGYSVAVSGNALIATGDPSSAYIFRFDGSNWIQEENLGFYGPFVDIDGDVAVVGPHVFRFNGTSWNLEQVLTESSGQQFNGRCALDGQVLAISSTVGSAYVYEYSSGVWTYTQELFSGGPSGPRPTTTVSTKDGYLAVGEGAFVSIFKFDGSQWQLQQTINLPGRLAAVVTIPLAINGSHLMVGYERSPSSTATVVRAFANQNETWVLLGDLTAPNAHSTMGWSVAIEGDRAILGAPFDSKGTAWLYHYCSGHWTPEAFLASPALPGSIDFGWSVAMSGTTAVVGSPLEWLDPGSGGAVYVFDANIDCNNNLQPDSCERAAQSSLDCDSNLVLDECEPFTDCNDNSVRDACDIAAAASGDCNHTATPDECDIASGASLDSDGDDIPDECFHFTCPPSATEPIFSLKAVARNGVSIPPFNSVSVAPGDLVDAELFITCWGTQIESLGTYQATLLGAQGAQSGTHGLVLPLGWDAPLIRDLCPCADPLYPLCDPLYGCIGPEHDPAQGSFLDASRPDYLFYGLENFPAVDVSDPQYRVGSTVSVGGALDDGQAHYGWSLRLMAGGSACGEFVFSLSNHIFETFLWDSNPLPLGFAPQIESLVINVCADDGLFCNGLETCDAIVGCQITPPPSCNDGVACTIDSCNEVTDGCTNALNHAACDDGNICTRDECSPSGCVNIDDQCGDIPTTSHWGLAVLALCLLIAAKVGLPGRRTA